MKPAYHITLLHTLFSLHKWFAIMYKMKMLVLMFNPSMIFMLISVKIKVDYPPPLTDTCDCYMAICSKLIS